MMPEPWSDLFLDRLTRATHVTVLTGAGISAESGIPPFRDPGGIWDTIDPKELSNIDAFLANPSLVQSRFAYRAGVVKEAAHTPAHLALVQLERLLRDDGRSFTLITQNVDNLHSAAGHRRVLELHGNLLRNYCINCNKPADVAYAKEAAEEPVRCDACGGLIRPDVVWFGEILPQSILAEAIIAAKQASVFLTIGTSAVVYPAAQLPLTAAEHGAYAAEINIEPSDIAPGLHETIRGKAGEILPRIVDAYAARLNATVATPPVT